MKKIAVLFLCVALVGCAHVMACKERYAKINRNRLSYIARGMTKEQVLMVMGQQKFGEYRLGGLYSICYVCNPLEQQQIALSDGTNIEVVYYMTTPKHDKACDISEATPLIFKDNLLIGIGDAELKAIVSEAKSASEAK